MSSLRYSTECVLRDFERDGVVYLELRTTPREFRDAEGQVTLTKEGYVATVLETIENYHQDPENVMRARLILSVDRRNTKEEAEECLDLAIRFKDRGVVALDLCGNPLVRCKRSRKRVRRVVPTDEDYRKEIPRFSGIHSPEPTRVD